jgi:hypothetical protein
MWLNRFALGMRGCEDLPEWYRIELSQKSKFVWPKRSTPDMIPHDHVMAPLGFEICTLGLDVDGNPCRYLKGGEFDDV